MYRAWATSAGLDRLATQTALLWSNSSRISFTWHWLIPFTFWHLEYSSQHSSVIMLYLMRLAWGLGAITCLYKVSRLFLTLKHTSFQYMTGMWFKKTMLSAVFVIELSVTLGVCLYFGTSVFLTYYFSRVEPFASLDYPTLQKFTAPMHNCLLYWTWSISLIVIFLWRFFTFSFQPGKLMVAWENEDQYTLSFQPGKLTVTRKNQNQYTRRQGQPHEHHNAEEILVKYVISFWTGGICSLPAYSDALHPHLDSHLNSQSPNPECPAGIIIARSKPQHRQQNSGSKEDHVQPVHGSVGVKKAGTYELTRTPPGLAFDAPLHVSPYQPHL